MCRWRRWYVSNLIRRFSTLPMDSIRRITALRPRHPPARDLPYTPLLLFLKPCAPTRTATSFTSYHQEPATTTVKHICKCRRPPPPEPARAASAPTTTPRTLPRLGLRLRSSGPRTSTATAPHGPSASAWPHQLRPCLFTQSVEAPSQASAAFHSTTTMKTVWTRWCVLCPATVHELAHQLHFPFRSTLRLCP